MKQNELPFVAEFKQQTEAARLARISDKQAAAVLEAERELAKEADTQPTLSAQNSAGPDADTKNPADEIAPELSNIAAFDRLLEQMRDASLTQRDAGTRFETLVKSWLERDEAYRDLFVKIERYADWARIHPEEVSNAKDTGIDLVGTNVSDNRYTAIQCKMYALNHSVSKGDIDSFISASDKTCFTRRMIIATNEKWNDNVRNELRNKPVPVEIITRKELASSTIDWSAYMQNRTAAIAKRVLRPYQKSVINKVIVGFKDHDRGQLIMACGTGKTFTSMKLAEKYVGAGGLILFLVPSLALLSQTLADWKRQCSLHINAFAVCSDTSTGKADVTDEDALTSVDQLAYPATTDAVSLVRQVSYALESTEDLTVIFATYQSLEVIHQAQFCTEENALPEFNLVICDEAHRTAGTSWQGPDQNGLLKDESSFVKVHDNSWLKASRRLYMTATPKIYGSVPKEQAQSGDLVLYSMDDEATFGPVMATISFTEAIDLNCLVDYKVIVFSLDSSLLENEYNFLTSEDFGGMSLNNAAKIVSTWRALSKIDIKNETSLGSDIKAMKRAVGFAQQIDTGTDTTKAASKQYAAYFNAVIDKFKVKEKTFLQEHVKKQKSRWSDEDEAKYNAAHRLTIDSRHIDGTMNATEKESLLAWLRAEPEPDQCKILFNVRCLSEGVDVPSLDAVIFLSPRKSPVDVVQTVGRVMRTAPGKTRGYVILPVVVPAGVSPDLILNHNKEFEAVWQILNALKAIDPTFGRAVDGETGRVNPDRIEIIAVSNDKFSRKTGAAGISSRTGNGHRKSKTGTNGDQEVDPNFQESLDIFGRNPFIEETIKSCIVKKVGNRREWEDWAEDVGQICQTQIGHIRSIVKQDPASRTQLTSFMQELKDTLNGELTEDSVIEMLGQHVVIKPVLQAIFSDYQFAELNPISKAMSQMLERLDKSGMRKCEALLEPFYRDVERRMATAHDTLTRQTIIKDLFDRFFKVAFPKMRDKLGIVYTPLEIVDFINASVADLLKQEFGHSLGDPDVHILDPFTGTGTFMVRLMQSGLIPKSNLEYKYAHDLHANELVPMAYYIAAMNIESAYHELQPEAAYKPNDILVLTDTFSSNDKSAAFKTALSENSEKLQRENNADIMVILGNPPYSAGQDTQSDDNQNSHYDVLDRRIAETYAAGTASTNKNALYDSYIRGFRWASDRIKDKGIVAFVTNAGWIDSQSASGMRTCFVNEFNSIYVYHLKGNQRTSGETSRREGGKVFGEGSRAPVAITFLVKNPQSSEHGVIRFHAVDDYLSREQKLAEIKTAGSILNPKIQFERITPDRHGDWLNQRDDSFARFMRLDGKKTREPAIFKNYSSGIKTSRDAWSYNSSSLELSRHMQSLITEYTRQMTEYHNWIAGQNPDAEFKFGYDQEKISWSDSLQDCCRRNISISFDPKRIYQALYRPFVPQYLYYTKELVERQYQMPKLFPTRESENLVIVIALNARQGNGQIALMTDRISDLQCQFNSQCFPRYLYPSAEDKQPESGFPLIPKSDEKIDAITDAALEHFQKPYGSQGLSITKDDIFYYIYGVLHSDWYREKYANNLAKELPRIPRAATYEMFMAYARAGRRLGEMHTQFEKQPEYDKVKITGEEKHNYQIKDTIKWARIPGKTGNAALNKTTLIYNEDITVFNIPPEALEYVINRRSALDWLVERLCVSEDKKTRIVNDFNQYAVDKGDPRYSLSLFLKVITISLETMQIIKALPEFRVHPLDMQS